MCGRYYIDDDTYQTVASFIDEDKYLDNQERDFCPSENIPVIIKEQNKYIIDAYKWGFSLAQSLVINARCETILEKELFKYHIKNNRCLIFSKGFYEWDLHKRKFSFESDDVLFMLGIYREKEKEVVIITTNANQGMLPIHNRMPIIISKAEIDIWFDDFQYKTLLNKKVGELQIIDGVMQQSLF